MSITPFSSLKDYSRFYGLQPSNPAREEGDPLPSNPREEGDFFHIFSLPEDLLKRFAHYLDTKDLGRLAQVSKKCLEYANLNEIWRDLCVENPDVDLNELSLYSGNYKALYRDLDLNQFKSDKPEFVGNYLKLRNGTIVYLNNLNIMHKDLKVKHLYRIAIKQIRNKPGMSSCKLEDFEIILFEKTIKYEDPEWERIKERLECFSGKYRHDLGYIKFKTNTLCHFMYCHQLRGNAYNNLLLLDYVEEAHNLAPNHQISFHNSAFKTRFGIDAKNEDNLQFLTIYATKVLDAWKILKPLLKESSLKICGRLCGGENQILVAASVKSSAEKELWNDLTLIIKNDLCLTVEHFSLAQW